MNETKPLVSIITVVYNARPLLEKTMQSVRAQKKNYPHIEYIVVDGASKDGTTALIEQNADIVSQWISEPDKGIYDAMNKGLKMATGQYVWFLNAGDFIFSENFLEKAFSEYRHYPQSQDGWADVYYGQTQLVDAGWKPAGMRRLRAPERLTPKSFRMGMLVCHQSVLVRRTIAESYEMRYKCSADYNWVLQALKKASVIENTHQIVSCYLKGGKSRQMMVLSWKERFRIMRLNFGLLSTLFFHGLIVLRLFVPAKRDYEA